MFETIVSKAWPSSSVFLIISNIYHVQCVASVKMSTKCLKAKSARCLISTVSCLIIESTWLVFRWVIIPERKRLEAFEMWCYRRMMNINGWIELQMKKFLEESEKEELCGRVWGREEVRWWGTRGIASGYLGGGGVKEKGKAQIKIFRPNNSGYGMRDI